MPWHPALNPLRDALANLYPQVDDARRIATDGGLAIDHLVLPGQAANAWQAILAEAERQGRGEALIGVAVGEHPGDPALSAGAAAYRSWVAEGRRDLQTEAEPSQAPGARIVITQHVGQVHQGGTVIGAQAVRPLCAARRLHRARQGL